MASASNRGRRIEMASRNAVERVGLDSLAEKRAWNLCELRVSGGDEHYEAENGQSGNSQE